MHATARMVRLKKYGANPVGDRAGDQPPVPEPPDEVLPEVLAAGAALDELPDDSLEELVELPPALLDELPPAPLDAPEPPDLLLEDAYKSAYQPPPFKMKFPPLICRLALACPHFGQVSRGASEIFWISSQWFWQSVQTYS